MNGYQKFERFAVRHAWAVGIGLGVAAIAVFIVFSLIAGNPLNAPSLVVKGMSAVALTVITALLLKKSASSRR